MLFPRRFSIKQGIRQGGVYRHGCLCFFNNDITETILNTAGSDAELDSSMPISNVIITDDISSS